MAALPPALGLGGPKSRSRRIFAIHDPWMKGLSMGDVDDIIAIYAYAAFYDDVTVFIVNDSPTPGVPDRCAAFIAFITQAGYPPPTNVRIICDNSANLTELFNDADDIFWFAPVAYEPATPTNPERGDRNLKDLMVAEFRKDQGRKPIYLQGDYNVGSSNAELRQVSAGKFVKIDSNLSNRQLTYGQLLQIIPDRPLVTNKIMEYYPIKLTCFPDVTLPQTFSPGGGFQLLLPQRLYVHEGGLLGNNLIQSLDVLGYTLKPGENASTVACRYMVLRNDGMANEEAIVALQTDTSTPDAAVVAQLPFVTNLYDAHPSVINYLNYADNTLANKTPVRQWRPDLENKLVVGLSVALVIVSERLHTSDQYGGAFPPNKSIDYVEDPGKVYGEHEKTTNAFDFLAVVMIKNGYTPTVGLQNKLIEDEYWDKFLNPDEPDEPSRKTIRSWDDVAWNDDELDPKRPKGGTRRKKHRRTRRPSRRRRSSRHRKRSRRR
jgi:hypothetical protein